MRNLFARALAARALPPFVVASGLASALSLQHVFGWLPCPLCVVQRLTAIALFLALFARAATRRATMPSRVSLAVAGAAALAGVSAAGAHLWLLYGPQTQSCGPGLALFVSRLVEALPGSEWLLQGAGACEDARYQVLGLPLPAWSMAVQGGATAIALAQAWKGRRGS